MAYLKDTIYIQNNNYSDSDDEDEASKNDRAIAQQLQSNEDAELVRSLNTVSISSQDELQQLLDRSNTNLYKEQNRQDADDAVAMVAAAHDLSDNEESDDAAHDLSENEESNVEHASRREQMGQMHSSNMNSSLSNINNENPTTADAKYAQELADRQMAYQMQIDADRELAKQLEKQSYSRGMVPTAFLLQNRHGQQMLLYKPCGRADCPNCIRRKREKEERQRLRELEDGDSAANGYGDNEAELARESANSCIGSESNSNDDIHQAADGRDESNSHGMNGQHDRQQRASRDMRHNGRHVAGPQRGGTANRGSNTRQSPNRGRGTRPRPEVHASMPPASRPQRHSPGLGLLREGSRVQGMFTRDEWNGIQTNPFALLDVLGNRGRGARRMDRADIDDADYESLWELADRLGEVKQRGLDPEEIDRMPTVRYQDDGDFGKNPEDEDKSQCKICLTDFSDGDKLRTLPCLHHFHQECIDTWIKSNAVCPICRTEIKEALK